MSARRWYSVGSDFSFVTSPMAIPAAGSFILTPAFIRAKLPPHIDAIEDDPENGYQKNYYFILYQTRSY
jgi:hypothetical protein